MDNKLEGRVSPENMDTYKKLLDRFNNKKSAIINHLLSVDNQQAVDNLLSTNQSVDKSTGELSTIDTFGLDEYGIKFFNDLCNRLFKRSGKNPYRMVQIACNYYYKGLYGEQIKDWTISQYQQFKQNVIKKDY